MLPALFPLLERLTEKGLEFVVVGGVAVVVHGVVRTTQDVDIVPDPSPDNLRALGNTLIDLDAALAGNPNTAFGTEHHDALAAGRSLSLTTSAGDLDVIQRVPGNPGFEALRAEAVELALPSGRTLAVASLAQLREMKQTAGRPQDLADLQALPQA